jgi:hypothetical protein
MPDSFHLYRIEPGQDFNLAGATNSLVILEDKLLKAYTDVAELKQKLDKILEYQAL